MCGLNKLLLILNKKNILIIKIYIKVNLQTNDTLVCNVFYNKNRSNVSYETLLVFKFIFIESLYASR